MSKYDDKYDMKPLPEDENSTQKCGKSTPTPVDVELQNAIEKNKQTAQYTEIISEFKENYKHRSKKNRKYKHIFFWTIIGVLVAIVGSFVLLCFMLLLTQTRWEFALPTAGGDMFPVVIEVESNIETILAIAGTGAATVIVALLKLPKIIAEHLFPLNEDRDMADIIRATK